MGAAPLELVGVLDGLWEGAQDELVSGVLARVDDFLQHVDDDVSLQLLSLLGLVQKGETDVSSSLLLTGNEAVDVEVDEAMLLGEFLNHFLS